MTISAQGAGRRTMVDIAADQLHEMILSGAIPAGHPLRLTALAEQLDMSPMPVREALRRLDSLGLVEIQPHRGAFVRALSAADLRDTVETRLILERAAIEKCAAAFDESLLEEAAVWLDRHETLLAAGMGIEAREAHRHFHFSLYRGSGSRWLLQAIEPVFRNSERYRFLAVAETGDRGAAEEHHLMLRCCRERDCAAAGAALEQHLTRSAHRMLTNLEKATAAGNPLGPPDDDMETRSTA